MFDNISACQKLSEKKLLQLRSEVESIYENSNVTREFLNNACIYACGSLGREEISETSDLDLFFIYIPFNGSISKLDEHNFFAKLYEINIKLGYKKPSKEGAYWNFHNLNDILDIGSQKEDFNNSFTARLLLLLESTPIYNISLYEDILLKTIGSYFLEFNKYKDNFLPMYLINDIFRYWYTLTLNYEFRRNNHDTKQKKYWKRLKLKYARLLTCYSAIACLFKNNITPEYVKSILKTTPIKRLDLISRNNNTLTPLINDIKKEYDWFLSLTKYNSTWWDTISNKKLAFDNADRFHDLVIHQLIDGVSNENKELQSKLDI